MAGERILELDPYEYGCIFQTMNDKRSALLATGENTDFIDEIILKLADAPYKKVGLFQKEKQNAER